MRPAPRPRTAAAIAVVAILLASLVVPVAGSAAGDEAASVAAGAPVLTMAEYRAAVDRALSVVQSASSDIGEVGRARKVSEQVSELIPEPTRVRVGGRYLDASDPDLASLVRRLGSAKGGDAKRLRSELEAHLISLEAALGSPTTGAAPSDPNALKRLLAARPSARSAEQGPGLSELIGRLVEKLMEWLGRLPSSGQAGSLRGGTIAVVAVLAAILVWVVVQIVRGVRGAARRRSGGTVEAGGDLSVVEAEAGLPDDALAFAEGLAGQRRFREALRALFGGAARALGRSGLVTRTRTRTNGELLAEVAPAAPEVAAALRPLSDGFEVAWYGHVDPGDEGYAEARAYYAAVLDAAERQTGSGGAA